MPDIFISYVEEDGRIADQIAQGLQAVGYSTWHYEQDGLPGTDYLETIGEVIDAAQAIIIIISAKSVQSQQVYRELVRAAENEKALFPLLYGIKHEQFQERSPKWRQALGATTSIGIPPEGVGTILPRLLAGLEKQGIQPSGQGGTPLPPPPLPLRRRAVPMWAIAALVVFAMAATVAITLAVMRHGAAPSASPTAVSREPAATTDATDRPAPTATSAPTAQPVPPADTPTPTLPADTPTAAPPAPTVAQPTAAPALDLQVAPLQLLDIKYSKQIAWSPDGKQIAIRASDLRFLDAETYQEKYAITSVQWPASIAFSPDGSTFAYANDLVTFLQVGTWGDLGMLPGSSDTQALAYSPDGKVLATAIGQVVKVWDPTTAEGIRILPGTSPRIGSALAISPDGQILAVAGGLAGGEIKRWNLSTGDELPALTGHTNWISALEFSPDGRLLASGSVDQSVRLWDVAAGRLLAVLTGHSGEVTDVAFAPDSRLLASASWDLSVKLWDTATGTEVESLLGHTGWVECVAFSPDGRVLASGSGDGVRLWSIESGSAAAQIPAAGAVAKPVPTSQAPNAISPQNAAAVKIWKTLESAGAQVTWSPDRRWLGVGGSQAALYDATSLEQVRTFTTPVGAYEIAFSPDSQTLAVLSGGGSLFAVNTGAERHRLYEASTTTSALCSSFLAFSPDGAALAVVEGDTVRLFDVAAGQETNTLVAKGAVAITYAADGKGIFAGAWGGITLLDVANGQAVRAFGERLGGTECLVLAPGGAVLASAGVSNDAVILWDASTGRQIRTLPGHEDGVLRLAFSPDGRILASSGRDVTIRLWDVTTGEQLGSLVGHSQAAESLAFSPDGVTLASAGRDLAVRLWRVAP